MSRCGDRPAPVRIPGRSDEQTVWTTNTGDDRSAQSFGAATEDDGPTPSAAVEDHDCPDPGARSWYTDHHANRPAMAVAGVVLADRDQRRQLADRACLSIYANDDELMLFGAIRATVFTRASCTDTRERDPHSFGLVHRSDGSIGVLHRVGTPVAGGYVHYLAVDDTGTITVPQTLVGSDEQGTASDSGFDLHGVPLGEHSVLYRELSDGVYAGANMLCYRLRAFDDDGSNAHDTPFQLACMRSERVTRSERLLELTGGYAALAWAERPRLGRDDNLTQITLSTPWDEGIYLTMIRPDGRRGSEIMRVTGEGSTIMGTALDRRTETSGPYPGDMTVSATSEGDRVVLAWRDERVDAPGIYLRSYTCSVTE